MIWRPRDKGLNGCVLPAADPRKLKQVPDELHKIRPHTLGSLWPDGQKSIYEAYYRFQIKISLQNTRTLPLGLVTPISA